MSKLNRLISDEAIEEALHYLATSVEVTAAARGQRIRAEFNRKQTRAMLMLRSPESSAAMREAWAESHADYREACDAEAQAVEVDEFHRAKRNQCDTVIEAWRTEQASYRAGNKFQ